MRVYWHTCLSEYIWMSSSILCKTWMNYGNAMIKKDLDFNDKNVVHK